MPYYPFIPQAQTYSYVPMPRLQLVGPRMATQVAQPVNNANIPGTSTEDMPPPPPPPPKPSAMQDQDNLQPSVKLRKLRIHTVATPPDGSSTEQLYGIMDEALSSRPYGPNLASGSQY